LLTLEQALRRAVANIAEHGDTDIFPFPVENRVIFDCADDIVNYLLEVDNDFEKFITTYPPANYGTLAPVGYTGFRWATQVDPLWNVYFLALVIRLGDRIEGARLSAASKRVFSYRFNPDAASSGLYNRDFNWTAFTTHALSEGKKFKYVVSCDISEFYPRLNHHRLDNALRQLDNADDCRIRIMEFLSNFSETYSFGLPVGGPAARLLSELTLNQIDRLLFQKRIPFCRFADDFYLFANSSSDAFKYLVYLSQILQRNQGLQLQKSKTRIMSSSEFLSTNPLSPEADQGDGSPVATARRSLFALSLHFDPYSPTATEDYERLSQEIGKFPILDMIKAELTKTRVDIALARRLIQTLKFISTIEIDDACRTLIENEDLLYPIYFNVLFAVRSEFSRLTEGAREAIVKYVVDLIESGSEVMSVDLNLQYAVRLLAEHQSEEAAAVLIDLYDTTNGEAIKRDIILIMARWRNWIWLSDRRAYFRSMTPMERRAYIVASYSLKDEGKHWRDHTKDEFTPFEVIVRNWAAPRFNLKNWEIPL
jgi:hypothetical protein